MNNLKLFTKEGWNIRTIEDQGKILFCGSDVAKALGYSNDSKALSDHCRWVTKRYLPHPQNPDKKIEVNFINEGDLYRLIAHSKLPSATRFESWVFDKVLPSIRQTGSYRAPQGLRLLALAVLEADKMIKEQEKKIGVLEPKAQVYDEIAVAEGTKDTGEVAKILGVGPQIFRKWLAQSGVIFYQGEIARPYQKWIEAGYLVCREKPYLRKEERVIYTQVRFTAKGELWVAKKYYDSRLEGHAS